MRFLSQALSLFALLAVGLLVVLMALRVPYPFELEWMEGGMLQHVERVRSGQGLYVAPGLDYMAFPYTPLFPWLGALLTGFAGSGPSAGTLPALRLISVLSTLACLALLYRIVRAETGSRRGGLVAAGLFAAAYEFGGAWYDVARVDMLSLAWVLGGIALARPGRRGPAPEWAGLFLFLGCLAKQSALGPAAGALLAVAIRDVRHGLRLGLAVLLPTAVACWLLDQRSDGWFRWHVFDLLAGHPRHAPAVLGFWLELLRTLGLALGVALACALPRLPRTGAMNRGPLRGSAGVYYGVVGAALVVTAWVGRMHVGGFDNTLIPASLAAAMLAGLAYGRLESASGSRPGGEPESEPRSEPRRSMRTIVSGLLILQFALLAYDPRGKVPTAADRAAGERIVERIRALDGEVWIPSHGYLTHRAGGVFGAHSMPLMDLLRGPDVETAQRVVRELMAALEAKRYSWIVLDDLAWEEELPTLRVHYRRSGTLVDPSDPDLFVPRTGEPLRPVYLYEARNDPR